MTMKVSKGEYRKILSAFSDKAALDIRHLCSVLLKAELEDRLDIERNILDIEDIAASAIPENQLKSIYERMTGDLGILKTATPVTKKMLKLDFSGLEINTENAITLSQVADEMGRPAHPLWNRKSKSEQEETPDEDLWLDEENGLIHFRGRKCKLGIGDIDYFLIQTLLKSPIGKRVAEDDILEADDFVQRTRKSKKSRRLYDARRRLNNKMALDLGITEFVGFEKSYFWRNQ